MTKLFFYVKESLKNIFRNTNTSLATVLSMSTAFFILGIILFIVLNLNNFVLTTKQDFSGIQIFLKNEVDDNGIVNFKRELQINREFSNIEFISKEETLKKFIDNMGSDSDLFSDIDNPVENSFIVHIENLEKSEEIVDNLKKDDRISSISYYAETLNLLIRISKIVSIASIFVIFILFVLSLLIIENMIKITIYSRMREIVIMKTIGATNWFIRWPFIIEGAVLGLIGSLVASFLLINIYLKLYNNMSETNIFLQYLIDNDEMSTLVLSLFLPTGICIGILGSITSLRKYLRV